MANSALVNTMLLYIRIYIPTNFMTAAFLQLENQLDAHALVNAKDITDNVKNPACIVAPFLLFVSMKAPRSLTTTE